MHKKVPQNGVQSLILFLKKELVTF